MRPNYIKRENLDIEKREKEIPEEIREKIKTELFKIPSERFDYPVTRSMEYGWETCKYLNSGKRKGRKTCDVVKYADEYYSMKGQSPYSNKIFDKIEKKD